MGVDARPAAATWAPGLVAGGLLLSGAIGALGVRAPVVAVGAVALLAAAFVTLRWPEVVLVLWLPCVFLGAVPGADVPVQGTPLVLGAVVLLRRRGALRDRHAGQVVAAGIGLLAWLAASLGWAPVPGAGTDDLLTWVSAIAVLVVVIGLVGRDATLIWPLSAAFVVGAAASAVTALTKVDRDLLGSAAPDRVGDRLVGGLGDPNTLAAVLVSATAFATLWLLRTRGVTRYAVAGVIAVLVAAFVGTQSRGGLVAAGATIVIAVAWQRGARARAAAGAAGLLVAIGFVLVTAGGDQRTLTTTDTGRSTLWRAGYEAFLDHPVRGLGLGSFSSVAHEYADRGGTFRYDLLVITPKRIHNTYLELLAEAGVVGLALFVLVAGLALQSSRRAARRFAAAGEAGLAAASKAVGAATVGFLTAACFLSIGSEKPLWLLVGSAVGLDVASRRRGAVGAAPGRAREPAQPVAGG